MCALSGIFPWSERDEVARSLTERARGALLMAGFAWAVNSAPSYTESGVRRRALHTAFCMYYSWLSVGLFTPESFTRERMLQKRGGRP